MASRPNADANIGFALSQPATVWRMFFEFKRFVLTSENPDARDRAAQFLSELEFGGREHADEMSDAEAEAGIALRTWSHDIAESEVAK
jgi:hypothetical protein